MPRTDVDFRSLLVATDVDVLPDGAVVEDRGEYVVVRAPSNPTYHWGNFLVLRDVPEPGSRARWEAVFDREIGAAQPGTVHVAITWDRPGADPSAVDAVLAEYRAAGFDVDRTATLVAEPEELRAHPRASDDAMVRALDHSDGADEAAWAQVEELMLATRDPEFGEAEYLSFVRARMADRRERFRAGDGAWYGAWIGDELAASCGVVVTSGRGRYQAVETAERFRRRGIATRLVHDAGRDAVERFGAERLVIAADAGYHALGLYESLGFVVRERLDAVCWWPGGASAAAHPERLAR